MVRIQFDLSKEEDRTVQLIQGHFLFTNKQQAIKKILQLVGEGIKISGKKLEIKIKE